MSASPERLRAAARIVRERGLAKGVFQDTQGRVCAYGAIHVAIQGSAAGSCRKRKVCDALSTALARTVNTTNLVVVWSDHPGRTADEVAAAFEAAADRLEADR